jgi:hypothetical protein
MNWYVAKIVFRITPGGISAVGQFDEHLRLIRAESLEQAYLKARLLGICEEDAHGGTGSREFVNVIELNLIQEMADGIALYSRKHEVDGAGAYVQLVHQMAATLTC